MDLGFGPGGHGHVSEQEPAPCREEEGADPEIHRLVVHDVSTFVEERDDGRGAHATFLQDPDVACGEAIVSGFHGSTPFVGCRR